MIKSSEKCNTKRDTIGPYSYHINGLNYLKVKSHDLIKKVSDKWGPLSGSHTVICPGWNKLHLYWSKKRRVKCIRWGSCSMARRKATFFCLGLFYSSCAVCALYQREVDKNIAIFMCIFVPFQLEWTATSLLYCRSSTCFRKWNISMDFLLSLWRGKDKWYAYVQNAADI